MSALRAGLRPWCVDLFADRDLRRCCPVTRLERGYPEGFARLAEEAPPGPWLFTGGLENYPRLVGRLAERRPLWGNDADVLRRVRSPFRVFWHLHRSGIPSPGAWKAFRDVPDVGRYLVKPIRGSGGSRISFWGGRPPKGRRKKQVYFQRYIPGESRAAVYLADGGRARLLGVTRQLVGEAWLHAARFQYCGSIGPLPPDGAGAEALQRLGDALAEGLQLRGLFGVDCVWSANVPWPVEVNPRYTASVEVLEWGTGTPFLALHRRAFEPAAPAPVPFRPSGAVLGKAVLFARAPLVFPESGPWMDTLAAPLDPFAPPAFADIPAAGETNPRGRPILSFFVRGTSEADCLERLKEVAESLDRKLFG